MPCGKKFVKYKPSLTEKITEKLKQNLPILNERQIRRHRIPYANALCLELKEDGFLYSAKFINDLLLYEDCERRISEARAIPWTQPLLKDQNDLLDKLYEGLKAAEIAVKENQAGLKCEHLLNMGIYFSRSDKVWCWLSDQLFRECVDTADCYVHDDGEKQAIARFIYGTFLFDQKKKAKQAIDQLRICRDLSAGKKWTASDVLGLPQKNLFVECCTYLYRALLTVATEDMDADPLKAARICAIAQKRASDAEDIQGEAKCMMLLGLCEMKAGDANSAISRFTKVLNMHQSENDSSGICECRIQLALANSRIGNIGDANYHLKQMLEYAQKNNLKYYCGQAYRFLGEVNLKQELAHIATPLLIKALNIFQELDDHQNRDQVRTLVAISAGQELYPTYVNLVENCKTKSECGDKFTKLIKWKETRETFWDTNINIDSKIFQRNDYEEID